MRSRASLTLLAALSLAGCGAGDPTYYRLATWPGQPPRAQAGFSVTVRAPTVAAYLDRDYIVESVAGYQLHLAGNDAWAEPIGDMIGRTFVADLQQRLPGDRVSGDAAGNADARIDLDISRFDRDGSSGPALLRGTLTLRDAGGALLRSEALDLEAPVTGTGSAAFTASESQLLGKAADRAAAVLATLQPPPAQVAAPPSG